VVFDKFKAFLVVSWGSFVLDKWVSHIECLCYFFNLKNSLSYGWF